MTNVTIVQKINHRQSVLFAKILSPVNFYFAEISGGFTVFNAYLE